MGVDTLAPGRGNKLPDRAPTRVHIKVATKIEEGDGDTESRTSRNSVIIESGKAVGMELVCQWAGGRIAEEGSPVWAEKRLRQKHCRRVGFGVFWMSSVSACGIDSAVIVWR